MSPDAIASWLSRLDEKLDEQHADTVQRLCRVEDATKGLQGVGEAHEKRLAALENPQSAEKKLQERHPIFYKLLEMAAMIAVSAAALYFFPSAAKLLGNMIG